LSNIEVVKYESNLKDRWDQFISNSKNGTFLFYRDYMEYHSDRFTDFSLMFYRKKKLIALLPASIKDNVLTSHGGLTFGGIVSDRKMRTSFMLKIFDNLLVFLKNQNINKVIYKAIPKIYHQIPADEDLYALFLNNAELIRRDLSSTIQLDEKISYNKGRKWSIKKSKSFGLKVKRSFDFESFMTIEEEILKNKYEVKPTHTSEEIEMLANKFPENIKLFGAFKKDTMLAGVIVYESKTVAHTQYIASSEEGKEYFSQDLILNYLIQEYYKEKRYFDFGISTEENGMLFNSGLAQYKEMFGASAVIYDFYEIDLK
jgi:hypothetical protein